MGLLEMWWVAPPAGPVATAAALLMVMLLLGCPLLSTTHELNEFAWPQVLEREASEAQRAHPLVRLARTRWRARGQG